VNPLPSWTPGSNKIIAEIPVGVSPHYAIFTPDGKRGLTAVQGPSLLAVFNAESNAVENSIKVGSRPHWVAAGPDNKTALTANEESNDISIIDLETGAVTNLRVGNAPRPHLGKTIVSARTLAVMGFSEVWECLDMPRASPAFARL
jgi:YVTN family beta-propeller protein